MKFVTFFCIVIGSLSLFGCGDYLYLKVKGPVSECVRINTGWKCFAENKRGLPILDSYSLMKLRGENANVIINGFYSEATSPAFLPEQIQFSFNNKKYYLCQDRGMFSMDEELSVVDEFGGEKVILATPRSIADACVFELDLEHSGRFIVVFAMLTPKSHNCELWILDENFNVIYDEILSERWHPQITLYAQGVFSIDSWHRCYKKPTFYQKKENGL